MSSLRSQELLTRSSRYMETRGPLPRSQNTVTGL